MNYKVICEISFPMLERKLDITIPVNKTVHYICEMLNKIIQEEFSIEYKPSKECLLINKKTGQIYDKAVLVKTTDIRTGTKLTFY